TRAGCRRRPARPGRTGARRGVRGTSRAPRPDRPCTRTATRAATGPPAPVRRRRETCSGRWGWRRSPTRGSTGPSSSAAHQLAWAGTGVGAVGEGDNAPLDRGDVPLGLLQQPAPAGGQVAGDARVAELQVLVVD